MDGDILCVIGRERKPAGAGKCWPVAAARQRFFGDFISMRLNSPTWLQIYGLDGEVCDISSRWVM